MRTDKTMFPLVEQWKLSGMSAKAFSETQGISQFSFQYWCKKYQQKTGNPVKQPKFIPLKINESPKINEAVHVSLKPKVELRFPGGLELRIY